MFHILSECVCFNNQLPWFYCSYLSCSGRMVVHFVFTTNSNFALLVWVNIPFTCCHGKRPKYSVEINQNWPWLLGNMHLSPGEHASVTWGTWICHLGNMNRSPGEHESVTWGTWIGHLGNMNLSPEEHESVTWETWIGHLGNMNLSPGEHESVT